MKVEYAAPPQPAPPVDVGTRRSTPEAGERGGENDRHAKPIVLVPACNRTLGQHPFHVVGKKYVDAVRLAGCQPLIVPSAEIEEVDALLALADGVLLTGSQSNVHPRHFGETVHDTTLPLDAMRDDWVLPLIPRVLALGMPLFAICRGFQEANVVSKFLPEQLAIWVEASAAVDYQPQGRPDVGDAVPARHALEAVEQHQ